MGLGALVQNESIDFSFEYIDKHEDKPWNWHFLAHREGLPFDIVLSHKEKDWDWHYLSTLDIFVPSVDLLNYLVEHGYEIDWNSVSENKELTGDVIIHSRIKLTGMCLSIVVLRSFLSQQLIS